MEFTPLILIHTAAALGAVVLGGATLLMKKGTWRHKFFGRTWVVLMLTTAIVSFWISRTGDFSTIHILSVAAIVGIGMSIYAVVHGRIAAHRRGMLSVYVSLVIAGVFTLLPERHLGQLVWHAVGLV